jgi:hypothetical protein
MPTWPAYFVVIAAIALAVQAGVLVAISLQLKRSHDHMTKVVDDLQARVNPILSKVEYLVGETQPRIITMVNDASEVVHMARGQAQKVDRVLTETLDRMRIQLIHADQILTGALETIEDTGAVFRKTMLGPVQQATAVIRGIKTGIDVLRSFRRRSDAPSTASDTSDEGMFI